METLGSLLDKLTILKLKEYHTKDSDRLLSIRTQTEQTRQEIDRYVLKATIRNIPFNQMVFSANKVYNEQTHLVSSIKEKTIGEAFYQLAAVNCELWHTQEKIYSFTSVPADQKDAVVHSLATLNIERNNFINHIDEIFCGMVKNAKHSSIS